MKNTLNKNLILGILPLLSMVTHGAIIFQSDPNQFDVAAGTDVVYTGDSSVDRGTNFDGMTEMGTSEGITMTMTSTIQGDWFFGGSPTFRTDTLVAAGGTITFTASANMRLQGDIAADDLDGFPGIGDVRRTAIAFNSSAETGTLVLTVTGGNESLYESYVNQTTPLAVGDTSYTSSDGESFFDGGPNSSTITGLPTLGSPDSMTVDANGGNWVALLSERNTGTDGVSFQNVTFEFTADTEVAAGTFFTFSFEGTNPAAQLALVPEPSSALLSVLGMISFSLIRRRKA